MAIITDTWNRFSFLPFSNAAWTGLVTAPALPGAVVKMILAGTTKMAYIIADGDPFTFAIEGGVATFPAAVVNTEALTTGVVTTSTSSEVTAWVQDTDNTLFSYGLSSGVISHFDNTNMGYLHTVTT